MKKEKTLVEKVMSISGTIISYLFDLCIFLCFAIAIKYLIGMLL